MQTYDADNAELEVLSMSNFFIESADLNWKYVSNLSFPCVIFTDKDICIYVCVCVFEDRV